jgi:uncharacterized RDD family membrane protein YckC
MARARQPISAAERAPAGLGRRGAARIVDGVLIGAVVTAAGVPLGFDATWLVGAALVIYGYFVLLDAGWGTTVGKRLLGLRVVGAAGGRATVGESMAREAFVLLGAVPFAGPVLALAAWVAIAVTVRRDPLGQGIHDRMGGGTTVVRS